MSRKLLIASLLVILGLGAWSYFTRRPSAASMAGGGGAGGPAKDAGAGGPVPVIAGTVARQDVPIYLDGLGTVQAYNTVTVHVRVDGQLDKVAYTEGQDVKAGDLLAVIDPRPYQATLDQAIAKKAQDEATLALGRVTLGRDADLLQKRVIAQQDFDTQKAMVDQEVAAVQADQAAIESAQVQVTYTRVMSPIDGRTGIRLVDQGNIVHASDAGGIVILTQLHPISVIFTLPEQDLISVSEEMAKGPLSVIAVDRDNAMSLGGGVLAVVDNQIDPTTATIKLRANFKNDKLTLWPGEFVNARLLLTTRKDGVVVPASVVQRGPQGTYAYVIKPDKTVEMRTIKVAQTEAGLSLIDDGLTPGEQVVVDGQYKLQPGARVDTGTPQPAGAGGKLGNAGGGTMDASNAKL